MPAIIAVCGVINVNVRGGVPVSLAQAERLGVRRVSYAASLFRETVTALEGLMAEVQAEVTAL